jgi:hypothetical protein
MPRALTNHGYVYLYDTGAEIHDRRNRRQALRLVNVNMCGQTARALNHPSEESAWHLLLGSLSRARQNLRNFNPKVDLPRGSSHSTAMVRRSLAKFQDARRRQQNGLTRARGRPSLDHSEHTDEQALQASLTAGKYKDFICLIRCEDTNLLHALETRVRQLIGTSVSIEAMQAIANPPVGTAQGLSEYVLVPESTVRLLRRRALARPLSVGTVTELLRKQRNTFKLKKPQTFTFRSSLRTASVDNLEFLQ